MQENKTSSERIEIRIAFERGDGPLRGELLEADGQDREFDGWLEFTGMLEELRRAGGRAAA